MNDHFVVTEEDVNNMKTAMQTLISQGVFGTPAKPVVASANRGDDGFWDAVEGKPIQASGRTPEEALKHWQAVGGYNSEDDLRELLYKEFPQYRDASAADDLVYHAMNKVFSSGHPQQNK